jgi:hypothetical protein
MLGVLLLATSSRGIEPGGPTHSGIRATADLPTTQHKRNVGGSDGAGLCVYTSAWHSAIWQDVRSLFDFRAWMQQRPGGSYPEKFDTTMKGYCASKGITIPDYIQHTGGDVEFLRLALRTGRMPAVTYCGVDGQGRYGNQVIAHMVSLAHLDSERAAIIDNNFPGNWLWMTAAEFIERWKGERANGQKYYVSDGRRQFPVGGGWAIVFLAPPPPPYVTPPFGGVSVGQCGPQGCSPQPLPLAGDTSSDAVGLPPSDAHEWGICINGQWGWKLKDAQPLQVASQFLQGGVISDRIPLAPRYTRRGTEVSADDAMVALSLSDDSGKWNLAVVGDAAFVTRVRADLFTLTNELREKCHVQTYSPDAWQVAQFGLQSGVTLRKSATNRIAADVGALTPAEYTSVKLATLIGDKPVVPVPPPVPVPVPPPMKPLNVPPWVLLALLVALLLRRK